jgi:hypothetical protein
MGGPSPPGSGETYRLMPQNSPMIAGGKPPESMSKSHLQVWNISPET